MNLYWVIVYPLRTQFPFPDAQSANRFCELACIYHPHQVAYVTPYC
jgi:hypothetical protein